MTLHVFAKPTPQTRFKDAEGKPLKRVFRMPGTMQPLPVYGGRMELTAEIRRALLNEEIEEISETELQAAIDKAAEADKAAAEAKAVEAIKAQRESKAAARRAEREADKAAGQQEGSD